MFCCFLMLQLFCFVFRWFLSRYILRCFSCCCRCCRCPRTPRWEGAMRYLLLISLHALMNIYPSVRKCKEPFTFTFILEPFLCFRTEWDIHDLHAKILPGTRIPWGRNDTGPTDPRRRDKKNKQTTNSNNSTDKKKTKTEKAPKKWNDRAKKDNRTNSRCYMW